MAEFSHTTEAFEKLYRSLNSAQKKAVDTIDGPVMVIAGPGTGKTQILALRIANILRTTDTPPDAILALAFTESAVYSMRQRLVSIVGSVAYKIPIFTFHGLANDIIERFPENFPRLIGSVPAADIDQIDILSEIIEHDADPRIRPYGDPLYYLASIRSTIQELKRENIGPNDFKKRIAADGASLAAVPEAERVHEKGAHKGKVKSQFTTAIERHEKNKALADVYAAYERELAHRHFYDFEDMIREVVAALRADSDLLLRLQEQYQFVLADEHQDANAAQNALLELLVNFHERPNLFIVGDEKQAIFRFQGASLDNFLYFKKRFPEATIISLTENYRSTQRILDVAFELIDHNKMIDQKLRVMLHAARPNLATPTNITLCEVAKPEQELAFVVTDVAHRLKENPAASIAIIYRTNSDASDVVRALQNAGVPYLLRSSRDVLDDPTMTTLVLLLRVVAEYGNDAQLARLLYADFLGTTPLDVFKITRYAARHSRLVAHVIAHDADLAEAGVTDPQPFLKIAERLTALAAYAKNHPLLESFDQLLYESGFLPHLLTTPEAPRALAALETLTAEVKKIARSTRGGGDLGDLVRFIDAVIEHAIPLDVLIPAEQAHGVQLMTAHKSKGLEFETVYIIGAREGHWGGRRSRTHFHIFNVAEEYDAQEDERRLFYVALTRAMREVIITWSTTDESGKEHLPSQFVTELNPALVTRSIPSVISDGGPSQLTRSPVQQGASLTNLNYIQELFRDQGWSVSALNNFLTCPWQYFFRNLVRLPELQTKYQLYGTAMHDTLEQFFRRWGDERDMTKTELLDFFARSLRRQPLAAIDYQDSLEKGKKALSGWLQWYAKNPAPRAGLVEYAISGVSLPVSLADQSEIAVPLRGKLDRIAFLTDRDVVVTDFKTAKPKSRNEILGTTKNANGDYFRQLVFYRLLLDLYDNGRWRMQAGEINFIEPDSRDTYHQERFEITDDVIALLRSTIASASRDVWTGAFWNATCGRADCPYCRLCQSLTR